MASEKQVEDVMNIHLLLSFLSQLTEEGFADA